jgi:hypothetical protein
VGANTLTPVNERGIEMLTVSGTDYLMTGGLGAKVTPHAQTMATIGGGRGSTNVTYQVDVHVAGVLGDTDTVVDKLKWPLIDAMRDVHNARAGRDN